MSCHACNRPAQHRCGECKNVLYCSPYCQRIDWEQNHAEFCGLIIDVTNENGKRVQVDDDNLVGFETSDGERFILERGYAERMVTIAALLQDLFPIFLRETQ